MTLSRLTEIEERAKKVPCGDRTCSSSECVLAREDIPALCKALHRALEWTSCFGSKECDPEDLCDPCEMRAAALAELENR